MATPREILNRTAAHGDGKRLPDPVGPEAHRAAQRIVVPQPIRKTSVYRNLMRSHDRVNNRHIRG